MKMESCENPQVLGINITYFFSSRNPHIMTTLPHRDFFIAHNTERKKVLGKNFLFMIVDCG
jgi:hypothetical protein